MDLSNAESSQLLSNKEYEICSNLRIIPRSYLYVKEMMVKECEQNVRTTWKFFRYQITKMKNLKWKKKEKEKRKKERKKKNEKWKKKKERKKEEK